MDAKHRQSRLEMARAPFCAVITRRFPQNVRSTGRSRNTIRRAHQFGVALGARARRCRDVKRSLPNSAASSWKRSGCSISCQVQCRWRFSGKSIGLPIKPDTLLSCQDKRQSLQSERVRLALNKGIIELLLRRDLVLRLDQEGCGLFPALQAWLHGIIRVVPLSPSHAQWHLPEPLARRISPMRQSRLDKLGFYIPLGLK